MEIQDHAQARHPVPPAGPAINRRFAREPVHARVLRVMALGCGLRFRLAVLAVGEEYSGSSTEMFAVLLFSDSSSLSLPGSS